jgi:hypothetical protein
MRIKGWMLGIVVGLVCLLGGRSVAQAAYWTRYISEEAPYNYTYCDWDEGMNGIGCSGSYCDNLKLSCENLPSGVTGDPSTDRFTSWFSEEDDGGIIAQEGEGFGSSHLLNERYCNSHVPGTIDSFGPAVVAGWQCSGSYCDNQSLECVVPKHTSDGSWGYFASCVWTTTWYSEENSGFVFSTASHRFVVGVRCGGSYCDNKQFYSCVLG